MVELSQRDLTQEESEELPVLIHSVNDIERIGDHAENISELAERVVEKNLPFSDEAMNELALIWNELNSMMIEAEDALRKNDKSIAARVIKREETINNYQVDLKNSHVNRVNQKMCDLKSGIVFMDFVDNLEKIGDHLTNIVEAIEAGMRWQATRREKEQVDEFVRVFEEKRNNKDS